MYETTITITSDIRTAPIGTPFEDVFPELSGDEMDAPMDFNSSAITFDPYVA